MPDVSAVTQVVLGIALLRIGERISSVPDFGFTLAGSAVILVGLFLAVYGLFAGVEAAVATGVNQDAEHSRDDSSTELD